VGFRPPIWRRVEVDGNISLGELHLVIQIVMGWEDAHLHQFIVDDIYYSTPYPGMEDWGMMDYMRDANEISLRQVAVEVGVRFIYKYDFGDSWEHVIRVEQIKEPEAGVFCPVCLTGKRACPPEDVGGIWGYEEFLSALQNKNHPEHEMYSEWIGGTFDPENFDLEESNRMLSFLDFYKVFKREKAPVYTDRQGQYLTFIYILYEGEWLSSGAGGYTEVFSHHRSFRQQHAQDLGKTRSYIKSSSSTALNQAAPVQRGTPRPVISRSILPSISNLLY